MKSRLKKWGLLLLFLLVAWVFIPHLSIFSPKVIQPVIQAVATQAVKPLVTPKPRYLAVAVPKHLKERVAMDRGFALGFANFLCGVNYSNCQATTVALRNMVTPELWKLFSTQFFTKEEIKDITERRLKMSFLSSKNIIPIEVGDNLDKFLVEGILTTTSDLNPETFKTSRQPVAMIVGFAHGMGTSGEISIFEKVEPSVETVSLAQGGLKGKRGI